MPRGRPPKPVENRKREGGTAKRGEISHRPVAQPVVVGGRESPGKPPSPPKDLPDAGVPIWVDLVRLLEEAGLLDRIDLAAIRVAVIQYVQHDLAAAAVAELPEDDAVLAKSLEETAALLAAKKFRTATKLRNGEDVPASEIDGIAKADVRLANLRDYMRLRSKLGGMVGLGSTGQVVEHPLVSTQRGAATLFLRFAEQFGATTLARTRIALGKSAGRKLDADLERELGRGRRKSA